jgi:hypothetical protein
LTETIISKDTFNEFDNQVNNQKNINIKHRNIEFRASYTPNQNFEYSSKNTILTNLKSSNANQISGLEYYYETNIENQNEPSIHQIDGGNESNIENYNVKMNQQYNMTETSQDFNTFKKQQTFHKLKKKEKTISPSRGNIKNIQLMFPQDISQQDIIRSQLNTVMLEQIKEFSKELKQKILELITFNKKIEFKIKKEIKIQSNKIENDIMVRVSNKIEKMEDEENFLKDKIKNLKKKIKNLKNINEGKTREITDILSRVDYSVSTRGFRMKKSRNFEIACTGRCKYKKDKSYEKYSMNKSKNKEHVCTCYEDQSIYMRNASDISADLENKLSLEKKKRKQLEEELMKFKKDQSAISVQNLKIIEENQKNKKLLLFEKTKNQEIRKKYEEEMKSLRRDISSVEKNRLLTSENGSPEFKRHLTQVGSNNRQYYNKLEGSLPKITSDPKKNYLRKIFLLEFALSFLNSFQKV